MKKQETRSYTLAIAETAMRQALLDKGILGCVLALDFEKAIDDDPPKFRHLHAKMQVSDLSVVRIVGNELTAEIFIFVCGDQRQWAGVKVVFPTLARTPEDAALFHPLFYRYEERSGLTRIKHIALQLHEYKGARSFEARLKEIGVGTGKNDAEAIGNLVLKYPWAFGLTMYATVTTSKGGFNRDLPKAGSV